MSMKKYVALAAVAALTLAGCASPAADTAASGDHKDLKICVYTHGDGGTFWSVFQKGAEAAAADLGVTLDYQGANNDAAKQASTIEAGVAAGCSGIATSVPDAEALQGPMDAAKAAGIPTVTANSGSSAFAKLGAFTHVGQDEVIAGEQAGLKFNAMGVKHVLCPIQEAGNVGLADRCKGLKNTFTGKAEEFNLDGGLADLTAATAKLQAALEADKSIDAIFALNADIAAKAAMPAAEAAGVSVKIGTVDMSPEALDAIEAGTMEFAIDQQQYAQGYMAVTLLFLNLTNGHELGGGQPIYTGPGFVTKDNVTKVKELVAAGSR